MGNFNEATSNFAQLPPAEQHQIAEYIVACALRVTTRKIHLSVLYGRELPAFPYHWKYKNAVGVSFPAVQTWNSIEAWLETVREEWENVARKSKILAS